ncbi:MAG: hypothetical protein K6F74_04600 [Prevotella sp.]|nr:hypothetical protein [Prevotella sp.]
MNKKKILTVCAILLGSVGTMTAQVKLQSNNVDEVLKAMTLEEKAMLVVGGNRQIASADNNGMIGGHAQRVPGAAGATQAIPRLGIPSTVLTDGPAGVRISPRRNNDENTYFCTGFPVGTALACTWNTQLVEEVGCCIGNEVLEYGCDVLLAPGMNIHRSPLCGRNFEYYSSEPIDLYIYGPNSRFVVYTAEFEVPDDFTDCVSDNEIEEIFDRHPSPVIKNAGTFTVPQEAFDYRYYMIKLKHERKDGRVLLRGSYIQEENEKGVRRLSFSAPSL